MSLPINSVGLDLTGLSLSTNTSRNSLARQMAFSSADFFLRNDVKNSVEADQPSDLLAANWRPTRGSLIMWSRPRTWLARRDPAA